MFLNFMPGKATYSPSHFLETCAHLLKQHLVGIRGQIAPCVAPQEDIGAIRLELQQQFEKNEDEKAKQSEINERGILP